MSLPFLPGNNFNKNLGNEKFHKSHFFDYCNETAMVTGAHRPGIGGRPIPGQVIPPKFSNFPKGIGATAPAWVAYDRQVLNFKAYYQEGVIERRDEQYRVRNCKLYFYLEDDSIQVVEPVIKNAGMPQGTIIKRHRIAKPAPDDDQFYTVEDFNIGNELILYGKKFKLCDGDDFTKNFLKKLGVKVGEACPVPNDPYSTLREEQAKIAQPLRPYEKMDTLKQFLDHDRRVLRFFCYWDDRDTMFGDRRDLVLCYYLADDTIEIYEKIPANAGRDNGPVFLRRGRLPKNAPMPMLKPGEATSRTVLNVFGPMGHGGRYILDSLKTGAIYEDYYKDEDLMIGSVLNAWGRRIVLCDCDEFTKDHYKCKFGIDKFEKIVYKESQPPPLSVSFPPYNGFGSEMDSLATCLGLVPKPPKRDFIKFLEKDRVGLESHILRFVAYMITDSPIDSTRKFIVSYYLSDDTVSFFEPPLRNSGVIGGQFLERRRLKKPHDYDNMEGTAEYYELGDLYVGARCTFNKFDFILTDADEYALRYMETHCDEFPHSNMALIIPKITEAVKNKEKELKELFVAHDSDQSGNIPYTILREQLLGLGVLSEHEIMTVGRNYSSDPAKSLDVNLVLAVAQEKLKSKNFENFDRLMDACEMEDDKQTGLIDLHSFRCAYKSHRLPISYDIMNAIERSFMSEGQIKYREAIELLNWRTKPAAMVQYQQAPLQVDSWVGNDTLSANGVNKINYKALVEDIFGVQQT